EDGTEKIFDFTNQFYSAQPERITEIEFLPFVGNLNPFKILYSTEQLAESGHPNPLLKTNYELSILDPALQTRSIKSFSTSFGLSAFPPISGSSPNTFLIQRDLSELDPDTVKQLTNWDPQFHPYKNSSISEPRIVESGRSYADQSGWQIAAP